MQIYSQEIDLEWDGFDVKRDRMGDYIEARYMLFFLYYAVLPCPLSTQRKWKLVLPRFNMLLK